MASPFHDENKHFRSSASPAASYTDLSRSDIALLTLILNHAPAMKAKSPSARSYAEIVRAQVAKLPPHLRNRIPWLSALCPLHNKIVSLPMISLLKALQHEVDVCAIDVWAPLRDSGVLTTEQTALLTALEDLSALWTSPEAFETKYSRQQTTLSTPLSTLKCPCCILAHIGGNETAMLALGAFFIGRTKTSIWEKSKRVMWFEAWIRNSIEDDKQEDVVIRMWTLGSALHKVRKEYAARCSERPYVNQFVGEAKEAAKRKYADDRLIDEEEQKRGELDAYLTAEDVFGDVHGYDGNTDEGDPDGEKAWAVDDRRVAYAASSIYSRDTKAEAGVREESGSGRDATSALLSLYRDRRWLVRGARRVPSRERSLLSTVTTYVPVTL